MTLGIYYFSIICFVVSDIRTAVMDSRNTIWIQQDETNEKSAVPGLVFPEGVLLNPVPSHYVKKDPELGLGEVATEQYFKEDPLATTEHKNSIKKELVPKLEVDASQQSFKGDPLATTEHKNSIKKELVPKLEVDAPEHSDAGSPSPPHPTKKRKLLGRSQVEVLLENRNTYHKERLELEEQRDRTRNKREVETLEVNKALLQATLDTNMQREEQTKQLSLANELRRDRNKLLADQNLLIREYLQSRGHYSTAFHY